MDWLSLCVCGTKRNSNDKKNKKDGKRKKSKKSKKNSKQKGSRKPPPFIVDEFLRKSTQDEQPKEIVEKEWTNGEIVNYLNDCGKNQIGSNEQIDPLKINGSPSYQIGDDRESFEKSLENSERNADESVRESCDIDYDNVMLHSRCASSTADEDEMQVKCISDETERDEEVDLDEYIPRSGEPEDSSWTSEIEDKRDTILKSSFDRRERVSSRINFSKEGQGKSKAKNSSRKKGTRDILPPIKGTSRAEACVDNEELQTHGETNKFGFKRTAASHERMEIRRKLNSCSFEVRQFENEERSGKTARIRGEGSMIPRLASPLPQGMNLIKNDNDKSEIVQNGISLRVKNYVHVEYLKKEIRMHAILILKKCSITSSA